MSQWTYEVYRVDNYSEDSEWPWRISGTHYEEYEFVAITKLEGQVLAIFRKDLEAKL